MSVAASAAARPRRRPRRRGLIAGVTLGAVLALWLGMGPALERSVGLGLLYRLRGPLPAPADVLVVALDDASATALALDARRLARRRPELAACLPPVSVRRLEAMRNVETLPRALHGCLIAALVEAGAGAVLMDVHFRAPEDAGDDRALTDALRAAGRAVLLEDVRIDAATGTVMRRPPAPPFAGAAAGTGFFLVEDLPTGALAHVVAIDGFPDAAPIYASLLAAPPAASETRAAGLRVALFNLLGPPRHLRTISLEAALALPHAGRALAGATVFVGAAELAGPQDRDSFTAAWPGATARVAGVELMATAYVNAREGAALRRAPPLAQTGWVAGIAGAMVGALMLRRPWADMAFAASLVLALAAPALLFAVANLWTPVAFPLLIAAPLAGVAALTARYVSSRISLGRLLPAPVNRAAEEADAFVAATHTVLVLDMVGSTRFADRFGADPLRARLDAMFDRVVAAVEARRGFIVKFTGDGCLALFAEQTCDGRDADAACAAAADIAARIGALNAEVATGPPTRLRIGVESGHVIVGYMGARSRGVVDAVGDAVNTAARLEDWCKTAFPDADFAVAVGAGAAARVSPGAFDLQDCGAVRLRGKADALRVQRLRIA